MDPYAPYETEQESLLSLSNVGYSAFSSMWFSKRTGMSFDPTFGLINAGGAIGGIVDSSTRGKKGVLAKTGGMIGRTLAVASDLTIVRGFDKDLDSILPSGMLEERYSFVSREAARIERKKGFMNWIIGEEAKFFNPRQIGVSGRKNAVNQARNKWYSRNFGRVLEEIGRADYLSSGESLKGISGSIAAKARGIRVVGESAAQSGRLGGSRVANTALTAGKYSARVGMRAVPYVGAGLIMWDVGKFAFNTLGAALDTSQLVSRSIRNLDFESAPPESLQAMTERKRALMEIHRSRLNARQYMGSEAILSHYA